MNDCGMVFVEALFPDEKEEKEHISFVHMIVVGKISEFADFSISQLKEKLRGFNCFSVYLASSTDGANTHQLLITVK